MLAFEECGLDAARGLYHAPSPYAVPGGMGYVRWGLDSIERLLTQPHEDTLDEALMRLAVHTGERADSLCMDEIQQDLRWLCARLQLAPPKGKEAVKLYALGLLEDMASGRIPTGRTRALLDHLHETLGEGDYGHALNGISYFYWGLVEWDDLRLLRLEQGLTPPAEQLREFRQYAARLLRSMELRLERQGGLWHIRVQVA